MGQIRDWVVRIALAASLSLVAYFMIAALGVRFGLWGVAMGLGTLTIRIGPLLAFGVLALGVIAVLMSLLIRPMRGSALALAALVLPAALVGGLLQFRSQAQAVPPIHDISTDLIEPPGFSAAVLQARAAQGANSLDLLTKRVPDLNGRFGAAEGQLSIDLQRQAYGDVLPISVPLAPMQAQQRALEIAKHLGWQITRLEPASAGLEAQVRSFWFGFVDDIAVRIRPGTASDESVVDIRSVSRVGVSDVGANAKRVRAFSEALIAQSGGHRLQADGRETPTPCCAASPPPP